MISNATLSNFIENREWYKLEPVIDQAPVEELFYENHEHGQSLLDKVCFYNPPLPIIAKLLDKGLSPTATRHVGHFTSAIILSNDFLYSEDGTTPVYVAAQRNVNPKSMELLLGKGGDPNKSKDDGSTPVYIAAAKNVNPALMEVLLNKGAQENVHPDLLELLLSKGGDPNKPRKDGWTPLHIAASNGASIELVKLLLDFGADPYIVNQGSNALMLAVSNNHTHLIQLLRNPPKQTRWGERIVKTRETSSVSEPATPASPIEDQTPRRRSFVASAVKKVSSTLASAMRVTSPSTPREQQHLMFFSYAQQDCAAETMHLADKASKKFRGNSIFRDADVKFKLDELVEHVKRSKNVIVLLSDQYAHRPFTLVELHTALQSGANVVAVKVIRPGLKPFDFAKVTDDIESGKLKDYMDEKGWTALKSFHIDVEDVAKDLKAVMNVRACELNVGSATRVLAAMIDDVFEGIVV